MNQYRVYTHVIEFYAPGMDRWFAVSKHVSESCATKLVRRLSEKYPYRQHRIVEASSKPGLFQVPNITRR